jgi:hypothetical protein
MSHKKIAAIVTEYFEHSHADVMVGKFLNGIPADDGMHAPRIEIASMYLDQVNARDIGMQAARDHSVPVFPSVLRALTLGGDKLAVDGVLIIGEHGEYATNEKGQVLYPRKHLFEQVCGTLAGEGAHLPVFSDKHLSYSWQDALWMYRRAKELGLPFMAGSSLVTCWRRPFLEHPIGIPLQAAAVVSYGPIESYGFHALETLQCMAERRRGGETGVAVVRCLEGPSVWHWLRDNPLMGQLARTAGETIQSTAGPWESLVDYVPDPIAFVIRYRDGLEAVVLLVNGYTTSWGYAARTEGQVQATEFFLQPGPPYSHFSYLSLNVEEMFVTGTPVYPVERTLYTTGMLAAAMESRYLKHAVIPTPELDVQYQPAAREPIRPHGRQPTGACVA